MTRDEDDFRIRLGKVRDRGGGQATARRIGAARGRPTSFVGEVHRAIRRAGGNPNRDPRTGKGSGRFNARGRGAATALMLRDRSAWSRDGSGVRTRARRVAVKARVCDGSRGPHYHNVASRVTPSDKKTGLRPTSRMHQSANTDAPT